jgi:hypothetical protein
LQHVLVAIMDSLCLSVTPTDSLANLASYSTRIAWISQAK